MDSGTSEATITEADGKLYMFTRGARGYYVSTDNGATWGTRQKVTNISYYTGCQMNAITYSKKIDGKTAILLSAGTNARNNGKIFVGLVQDNGSITWKYKYAVNTGTFQYSCLSELKDGTVALLYEDGYASEKFVKYSIEDIAQGATIENGKEEIKQNNKKQSHYIRNGSCSISDRTGNDRRESAFQPDAGSSGASLCIYYPGSFPEPDGWYSG